jgi:hypothetical protein
VPLELPSDVNATVYADADAIDEVAELRVGGTAWNALTADQKDQAAATATAELDALEYSPGFLGERADPDQNLAWPRTGTDYADDAWPAVIVNSAIELEISYAPTIRAGSDVLNPDTTNGNIKSETVGPLKTEYFAATRSDDPDALARFPLIVQRWLRPLLRSAVTSNWGSAAVIRGS